MNNHTSYLTFSICILCVPFITPNTLAVGIDYKVNINWSWDILENNSQYNIEKAKLLEKYINGLLQEIFELKREHAINNKKIDQYVFNLKVMSSSLKKIQTIWVDKSKAESAINSVMTDLSASKQEIWTLLKEELQNSKIAFSQYKKEKTRFANIISARMLQFVNSFRPKVKKISNNKKKNDILSSIDKINTAALNLWNFWNRLFSSQLKMNESYNMHVKEIRRELQIIRAIIVSK